MNVIIEKCPFCQKELEQDSEKFYWHLKIHKAVEEAITQEIVIEPNEPKKL